MAQRRTYQPQQKKKRSAEGPRVSTPRPASVPLVRLPPVVYGKPFILMEDKDKHTFEFTRGAWVAYERTIAQCRLDCQVKELPQKVNNMTRYEVRCPVVAT